MANFSKIKFSGIYKITNLINNKIYIGSSVDLIHRKNTHYSALFLNNHCNKYLQKTYNKYKKENLKFEVLEFVKDKKELRNIEAEYIKKLNTCNPKIGYNLTEDTISPLKSKLSKCVQYYKKGVLFKEYNSLTEAAKELNISLQMLGRNIKNKIYTNNLLIILKGDNIKDYKYKPWRWEGNTIYKDKEMFRKTNRKSYLINQNKKVIMVANNLQELVDKIKHTYPIVYKRCDTNKPILYNNNQYWIISREKLPLVLSNKEFYKLRNPNKLYRKF